MGNRINAMGRYGRVDNPAVGLLMGEITSWELKAREDDNQTGYDFRATFSHLNEWMFNDPAIPHRIVIEIGRGQQYRLDLADDARTVLDGLSLLIEGVQLCRV